MKSVITKPDTIVPTGAIVKMPRTWQEYQVLLKHLRDRTYLTYSKLSVTVEQILGARPPQAKH